jgi:hypothetical protein
MVHAKHVADELGAVGPDPLRALFVQDGECPPDPVKQRLGVLPEERATPTARHAL